MRAIVDACMRLVFHNELPPALAPLSSRVGRTPLRIALGDVLNWLKGMADGFSGSEMPLRSSTITRIVRTALHECEPLGELFKVRQARLSVRKGVTPTERTEIAAYVRAHSRFPEDVYVRNGP